MYLSTYSIAFILLQLATTKTSRHEAVEILHKQLQRIAQGEYIDIQGSEKEESYLSSLYKKVDQQKSSFQGQHDVFRKVIKERQEYRCLTRDERKKFHNSLNFLKNNKEEGHSLSFYDVLVLTHNSKISPAAHGGPAFALWHRHFMYLYELLVRKDCPDCSVPFWDSRLERRLKVDPGSSVLFSPSLAGNSFGRVKSGFAANWKAPEGDCARISPYIIRYLTRDVDMFYSDEDVAFVEAAISHKNISIPWNDEFEMTHGYIHVAFGGASHMRDILCSPSDPLFFLHHVYVDNLYERVKRNMKRTGNLDYVDTSQLPKNFRDVGEIVQVYSAANHTMQPFDIRNSYGLFHEYDVVYDKSPGDVVCKQDKDCCGNGETEFIWCDQSMGKCISKIMEGGLIHSDFPPKACYCPSELSPFTHKGKCGCK